MVQVQPGAQARRWCAYGLAAGLALLPWRAVAADPPGTTTIGGGTYRLPDTAFADGVVQRGPQDSLLLDLPVPAAPGAPPFMVQVLLNAPDAPDAQARAAGVRASLALGASIAASLDPHRRNQPLVPAAQRVADAPDGLVQVATDPEDSLNEDVFVRPPIAAPAEYIHCSRAGAVAYPHCSQEFAGPGLTPGLTVKASYPRAALPEWQRIRQFLLDYLQQHQGA